MAAPSPSPPQPQQHHPLPAPAGIVGALRDSPSFVNHRHQRTWDHHTADGSDPPPYYDRDARNGNNHPSTMYKHPSSTDASSSASSTESESSDPWLRGRDMLLPSVGSKNPIKASRARHLKDSMHSNHSRSNLISPPPPSGAHADRKTQPVNGGHSRARLHQKRPPPLAPARPPERPSSDASEESIEEVESDDSGRSSESDTKIGSREDADFKHRYRPRKMSFARRDNDDDDDESDTSSSSAYSTEERERLDQSYERLEDKRDEVQDLREHIRLERKKLKSSRETKDTADNAFMSILRPLLAKAGLDSHTIPLEAIDRRFKQMQSTRTEYQELETSIEELEDNLSRAETDLSYLERRFLKLLYTPRKPQKRRPEDLDESDVPPSRTSLLGIPTARREDTHPLYDELMSAVGNLQLAEEHLQDLIMSKRVAEQEQEVARSISQLHPRERPRRRHSDYAQFLRNFESRQKEAQDDVKKYGNEVSRLKVLCEEKAVFPQHAPLHEIYSYRPDIYDDDDDDMSLDFDTAETLAHPQFPLLLSNPSHILHEGNPITAKKAFKQAVRIPEDDPTRQVKFTAASKELNIELLVSDFKEGDKSDLINRWLLQKLRTSPLEAELLYSTFLSHLSIYNRDIWEQDVLYFWPRDEANIPPDFFQGPVTSAEVEAPQPANFSNDVDLLRTDSWARLSQRRHQSAPSQNP